MSFKNMTKEFGVNLSMLGLIKQTVVGGGEAPSPVSNRMLEFWHYFLNFCKHVFLITKTSSATFSKLRTSTTLPLLFIKILPLLISLI